MNCIGNCYEIAFTVIDNADILQKIDGARLKISICVRKDSSSSWTPLGVELVKGGLSFLTPISRKSVASGFIDAEQFAKDNKVSLYGITTGEFVHDKLLPFKLKTEDLPKTFTSESEEMHVTSEKSNVHQSMVFVAESTINGAGQGRVFPKSKTPFSAGMAKILPETRLLPTRTTLWK